MLGMGLEMRPTITNNIILLTLKSVWASDVLSRSLSFIPQLQTRLLEWEIIIIKTWTLFHIKNALSN